MSFHSLKHQTVPEGHWLGRTYWMVLMAGIALRFYGIPHAENTDEYNEVFEALRVASGHFNLDRWHKKGLQNILAVEFGLYYLWGHLAQIYQTPLDFAAAVVHRMEPLFLIGRTTSAVMGVLSIELLRRIGAKLYNPRVGVMAAAFLAFDPIHVWCSHHVNTDVPLLFFFLASLYSIVRFPEGRRRDYVLAAVFAAVAINMKIMGVGILILFVGAHLLRPGPKWRLLGSPEAGWAAGMFVIGYFASNPAALLGLNKWLASFIWQHGIYTNVYGEVPQAIGGNSYYTYYVILRERVFGAPLFFTALLGALYALYRRETWDRLFTIFWGVMFLILANTNFLVQDRYLLTLFPAFFLLTGRLLDDAARAFFPPARGRLLLVAAVAVLAVFPLQKSFTFALSLTEESTGVTAKKWIEQNIPPESRLLVDAGRTLITSGPKLSESRRNLEEKFAAIRRLKEGETYDSPQVKIVNSYAAIYFELLLRNPPAVAYDVTTTELARRVDDVDEYRRKGFQYFIHDHDLIEDHIHDPAWRKKFPRSVAFYEAVRKWEPLQVFSPHRFKGGPTIKIYRFPEPSATKGR